MKEKWRKDVTEEKRQVEDLGKVGSKRIDADDEKELLEKGGFSRGQLYNRRGGLVERGLASLMDAGDTIIKIEEGCVHIKTREGTIQTFWNLDQPQDFLRPLRPEEDEAREDKDHRE